MSLQVENSENRTPEKKSALPRGCWIALITTGVLAVLFFALVIIGVYAISQNPEVQRVARAVGGAMRVMGEAASAPGTNQLRSAGCNRAMVFDTEDLAELARELQDDNIQSGPDPEVRLVVCQWINAPQQPRCDDIARVYVQAVPTQPGPFVVMVQNIRQQQTQCMSRYGANGQLLQQLNTSNSPNMPILAN